MRYGLCADLVVWVALPIKGERSGLTRLSPPFVFPSLPPSANLVIVILIFLCDRCGQLVGDRRLGSRSPVCHLVCPCRGGLCAPPLGPGLCLGFWPRGFLLPPSPVRPCRARLPWRVRLWSVRPWLASPGGSGVPSVLFLPLFPAVFGVSLLSPS